MNLDVADGRVLEDERVPLHGKIDKRRGEERHRHFAARFLDVDVVDLIRAAPEVQRHRRDVRPITGNLGELAIDVIAHPDREISVHHYEDCDHDNRKPKPPAFCERLHPSEIRERSMQLH